MRIFVAEDSPVVRERLVRMLRCLPRLQVVGVAETAGGTVAGVARLRPQVVTLDLGLKSGSGLDALRAIKRMDFNPVVIVLTVNDSPQHRERCLHDGADYFFSKATEFTKAVEVIAGLQGVPPPAPAADDTAADNPEAPLPAGTRARLTGLPTARVQRRPTARHP